MGQDHSTSPVTVAYYDYDDARVSEIKRKNEGGGTEDEIINMTYTERGQILRRYGTGIYPEEYDYDSYGRPITHIQYRDDAETDETKVTWTYQDDTGLVTQKKHWNGAAKKTQSLQYNKLNQVTKRTWARGKYTEYDYSYGSTTSTGDLESEKHQGSSSPEVEYTEYDRMGRPTKIEDYTGERTFTYGALSGLALSKEDLPNYYYGSGNDIDHTYEGSGTGLVPGRPKDISYDGTTWSQTYESATGRIETIGASGSGFSKTFDYTYDSDSNHVSQIDGGNYDQYRYYESWRGNYTGTTTTWNGSSVAKFDSPNFDWQGQIKDYRLYNDGSGTLAYLIKGSSGDIKHTTTYDKRGQVLSWDTDRLGGTESSYSWDSAGNPSDTGSGYDGQTFDTNGYNQIDPTSGTSFGYDSDGNLTSDANTTYVYDLNNRLIEIVPPGEPSDGDLRVRFKYDYMGRRVEKFVQYYDEDEEDWDDKTALSFKYVYRTGSHELLMEIHIGIETPERSYHWGIDKSDSRRGAGGAQGLLMIRDYNGTPMHYYPAYDFNGNVAGLLDDNGDIKAYYEYDAFGKIVKEGGSYKDKNPFRFSTQYTDDETGLVYYGLRYYDPSKGRFLNRDPIGESGGANLYRFVGNNPVIRNDVLGLWCSGNGWILDDCGGLDPADFPPVHDSSNDGFEPGGGGPVDKTQKDKWSKSRCDALQKLIDLNLRDIGANNRKTAAEVKKYSDRAIATTYVGDTVTVGSIIFVLRGAIKAVQSATTKYAPKVLPALTKDILPTQTARGMGMGGGIVGVGEGAAAAADANVVIGTVAGAVVVGNVLGTIAGDELLEQGKAFWGPLRWFNPLEAFAHDDILRANAASEAGYFRGLELLIDRRELKQEYSEKCE